MTDDELAAIGARCEAATAGPWFDDPGIGGIRGPDHEDIVDDVTGMRRAEDRDFTIHARSDVPALLAEVRRLREIVAPFERLEAYRRSRATPGYDHEHPRQAVCRVCFDRAVIESRMYPRAEADKEPE